jgi:hypothetical protein
MAEKKTKKLQGSGNAKILLIDFVCVCDHVS